MNQPMQQMMKNATQPLISQLRQRQPQMFQFLEQARQNQSSPMDLLKQVTGNYTPQQLQNFYITAQRMGFPDDVLTEIQNQMK